MFSLPPEELKRLHGEFVDCVAVYSSATLEELATRVGDTVRPADRAGVLAAVSNQPDGVPSVDNTRPLSRSDLALLAGYVDFATKRGLSVPATGFPLEVRIEQRSGNLGAQEGGHLAMLLTDVACSVIGSAGGRAISHTLSDDLYKTRFEENTTGSYTIGSYPGRSKFFSLAKVEDGLSKADVIERFGLAGYAKAKKPGPMYVLSVDKPVAGLQPKVVIAYKQKGPGEVWRTRDHFLEGSIPGFTQGGLSEVVCQTVSIDAGSQGELASLGITVRSFE